MKGKRFECRERLYCDVELTKPCSLLFISEVSIVYQSCPASAKLSLYLPCLNTRFGWHREG